MASQSCRVTFAIPSKIPHPRRNRELTWTSTTPESERMFLDKATFASGKYYDPGLDTVSQILANAQRATIETVFAIHHASVDLLNDVGWTYWIPNWRAELDLAGCLSGPGNRRLPADLSRPKGRPITPFSPRFAAATAQHALLPSILACRLGWHLLDGTLRCTIGGRMPVCHFRRLGFA